MTGSGSAPAPKISSHSRLWLQLRLHTSALNCSFMCAMIKFNTSFFLLFLSLHIFILLTHRKATKVLYIGKQLPQPASGDAKILLYACNLIETLLQFRTACQDHQAGENAVKCFSQEQNDASGF